MLKQKVKTGNFWEKEKERGEWQKGDKGRACLVALSKDVTDHSMNTQIFTEDCNALSQFV